ncbi:MAG: efflux RND transporter periplasmic adaptor subunit [Saprospiraceae bacterium]|nr:efflux RND transporter periplasmic adaptor subunit [Saprospiraceae bacterium]
MHQVPIYLRIIILLSFSGLLFCKEKDGMPTNQGAPPPVQKALIVQTLIATAQPLSADIEVPGTILANETAEIHPEVSGRLVQLNIKEGTNVSVGALLAKLNDGDLQAQFRKLEVQLKIAEQTEKRQAELVKIQGISQQEYDLSLLSVLNIKADMDIIRESIRKTEIRAPFGGRLGLKNVSPGAYVTPSSVLTTISQVSSLKIQFNVPERYGAQLKPGLPVSFSIDGTSKTFTATVIASEISIDENTRSLAVRALIKQKDPALIPGAFAKVKIVLGKNNEALMVPNSSIIPSGRKKLLYVYEGGKAMMKEVTTGVRDSTNIQVLTGIKPGDTVITSAMLFLRPGLAVELAKIN